MADYTAWKVVIEGTANTQAILNTLYYTDSVTGNITFSSANASTLNNNIVAFVLPSYLASICNQYSARQITYTIVNELGETVSPHEYVYSISGSGAVTSASSSNGMVGILSFNCTYLFAAQACPVTKRSYLAIGPIAANQMNEDGSLTVGLITALTSLAGAITGTYIVSGSSYIPCRFGRTTPLSPLGSVGRFSQIIVRPYGSFRRSRMVRTTG